MINNFLIADDDPDDADLFRDALNEVNASSQLDVTVNGAELLQRLKDGKVKPDVIFIDINMPVMNGWECLEVLKEDERFSQIPVIMYSTSTFYNYNEKALQAGAVAVYEKPSDFVQLKDFLKVVSSSSMQNLKEVLRNMQKASVHKIYS